MSRVLAVVALGLTMQVACAQVGRLSTCYVRTEAFNGLNSQEPAQSYIGLRRKTAQLFDLDVSVAASGGAVYSVSGVARVRGKSGQESLAMVVRPEPGRARTRGGEVCQVFVQLEASGLELSTTPSLCKTQSLCEGKVELKGQRFEASTRLPAATPGPCFKGAP